MSFGERSREKLAECHDDLRKVHELAITRTKVDYGISEAYRSPERQQSLYMQRKSKNDGYTKKGKHNYRPSLATDIYVYHPNSSTRAKISFDIPHLSYIAGVITSCAEELYAKGEISHKIRWGGNWDGDGEIIYDQQFNDLVHFELCD